MAKFHQIKLVGARSFRRPGGKPWKKGQSRTFADGDARVAYYRGKRQFKVTEFERDPEPAKPKKAAPAEEPVEELQEEPVETETPVDDVEALKDDAELEQMLKDDLIEYALELGLDHVDSSMTKKEIRADIDSLR